MQLHATSLSALNIYLVGGAVRDSLLNRKIVERDYLVVGSTAAEMLSLGFEQVGKDFPVFLHPETKEEYALARTEKKQGVGYTGFTCHATPDVTIEEDLIRRDLTVNAMAQDQDGNIIDPYNGQKDLMNKVLRHVSDAFIEDPLRVLRVARFAARYFQYDFYIAKETIALMEKISESNELQHISSERIWKEMQRSLDEANPEVFFISLYRCKALKTLWPSLDQSFKLQESANVRVANNENAKITLTQFIEMTALKHAVINKSNTAVRFATLCCNLSRILVNSTPFDQECPKFIESTKLNVSAVQAACKTLNVPNNIRSLALKVCQYHRYVVNAFTLTPTSILTLFNAIDVWRKVGEFNDFLEACSACSYNGQTDLNNKMDFSQGEYLVQLYQLAKQVSPKPFVEQGLKGLDIRNAIEHERLSVIQQGILKVKRK